jgi:hypothetical protein
MITATDSEYLVTYIEKRDKNILEFLLMGKQN